MNKSQFKKLSKVILYSKKGIIYCLLGVFLMTSMRTHSMEYSNSLGDTTVQYLNYKSKSTSIRNVCLEIEKKLNYYFVFADNIDSVIDEDIDISVTSNDIDEILSIVLKENGLSYSLMDKQVVVYMEGDNKSSMPVNNKMQIAQQQLLTITGTVVDNEGEPLIGVTIVDASNAAHGTISDIDGKFLLSNMPTNGAIVVSYVGMVSQTININNQKSFHIIMLDDSEVLEDVVVVGFGKQKKASVVGAVQTIKPSELRVPTSNLSTAFAGRIAGVTSVQRSGEPGADGASFWIRGISTFAAQTSPLIFIDGVEVSSSDMNALPPEVIESFSVLKDATATALYGARGANGVMLITTRGGHKMERARINIRVENSFTAPTQTIQLADGIDYMHGFNDAIANRNPGSPPRFTDEKIQNTINNINPYIFPNVDWQDMLFKDSSTRQAANVNVTGGGEKVTYFMSASINNDNGMLRKDPFNSFDNNIRNMSISMQGNISAKLTSSTTATLRLNNQIVQVKGSSAGVGTIYSQVFLSPPVLFPAVLPALNNEDHILFGNQRGGPHPTSSGENIYNNPYATMVSGFSNRNHSTSISTLELEQDLKSLTPGLKLKGLVSFKNWSSTTFTRSFTPYFYAIDDYEQVGNDWEYDYSLVTRGTTALSTSTSNTGDRLLNVQFNVDYNRSFEEHDVSAMLVYLQRDYNTNAPITFLQTLPTRNQGIAGRLTYGYDNRYMTEFNFGYNGSENFKEGNRWGFFPSAAIGYNISNEAFFEPIKHIVSSLKVRGSFGLVGNSYTDSRFPYITEVDLGGKGYTFGDNWQDSKNGAIITKYGTDNSSWEIGKKTNIGIDVDFFNSLSITADIFNEVRDGIFMQRRVIPAESGVVGTNPYANLGKVKNEGFDLSVNYDKVLSRDVILNVRANVTFNKNTLLDRDEPVLAYDYLSDINKPLNRYKGLIAEGLFKDQEDIDNSPRQTYGIYLPGDIKYKDLNDDGKIDDLDQVQIGDPTVPQLVYGFGASLSVKKFDVSFFFQGIGKTSLMMSNIHPYLPESSGLFQFIADDYWTVDNPNPNAKYPRLMHGSISHNNFRNSTYWLRDASFLRLKNVELGYTYKMARIYLNGQNLLTFSPFKHWDPEMGGGNGLSYPPQKLVNIGLQLTF